MTAQTYRVRNLKKYQHYKNRNPPWVKLHNKLLADQEFVGLRDSAWRLAFELVLLSSTNGEAIPGDAKSLSFLLRRTIKQRDVDLLASIGFIVSASKNASNPLAECLQPAPDFASEVREQSTETEGETETPLPPLRGDPNGFDRAWKTYPHYQGRSVKAEARKVWNQRKLETVAESVLTWIDAYAQTEDWQRESGSRVPGMQVWLKKPDFSDKPEIFNARRPTLSEAGRKTAEAGRRWLERGKTT